MRIGNFNLASAYRTSSDGLPVADMAPIDMQQAKMVREDNPQFAFTAGPGELRGFMINPSTNFAYDLSDYVSRRQCISIWETQRADFLQRWEESLAGGDLDTVRANIAEEVLEGYVPPSYYQGKKFCELEDTSEEVNLIAVNLFEGRLEGRFIDPYNLSLICENAESIVEQLLGAVGSMQEQALNALFIVRQIVRSENAQNSRINKAGKESQEHESQAS